MEGTETPELEKKKLETEAVRLSHVESEWDPEQEQHEEQVKKVARELEQELSASGGR